MEVIVTKLNKEEPDEWLEAENIALKVFPIQMRAVLAMCEGSFENLKTFKHKGNTFIDDILFVEVEGERVGCAMVAKQHSLMDEIEPRKNTLFLHFLMVLEEYRGHGVGTALLSGVFDYARQNGYDYVELINTIDLSKFKIDNNIYFQNDFNAINLYSPKNKMDKNNFNVFFRLDVDMDVRNLSKALYSSFKKLKLVEPSALNDLVLKNELEQNYVDIVSVMQPLTKKDLAEIKENPIFADLVVTLKSLLNKKNEPEPEQTVRDAVKVGAMLKQLNSGIKSATLQNINIPKIYHDKMIERILCGFCDERLNEETKLEILVEQQREKR